MIRRIKSKALRAVWEDNSCRGVPAEHALRIKRILDRLNIAVGPENLNLPGWRLHPLKGDLSGYWAVTVQANWRIIFRIVDGHATDIDYVDYH